MPGKSSLGSAKNQPSKKEPEPVGPNFKKILIWPEWSENELATEKFEIGGGGKAKDKSKLGTMSGALFEDPDGQPQLPPSLSDSVSSWKRASDYFTAQEHAPTIVSINDTQQCDILTANEHLLNNKLMASVISELQSLIYLRSSLPQTISETDQTSLTWQPWHHIYPWPKGSPTPVFNHLGKYCVKLYWMGCWRKVTIDDQFPVDDNDHILLPVTSTSGELWPLLITKALLKIFSLECTDRKEMCEEYSVTELLTGWVCESTDIRKMEAVWSDLTPVVPQWIRPSEDDSTSGDGNKVRDVIVLAKFTTESAELLTEYFNTSFIDPTYPILLTQWKDEPLELPPSEPPLPTLEAPYYLGLKNRQNRPGTTPPPPVKTDHRSFQLFTPYMDSSLPGWIDLDEFVTVFKEVRVYRKQETFAHCYSTSELSMTAPNSSIKKGQSHTQLTNKVSDIIFIDSCQPMSLLISFSSINCWYENGTLLTDTQQLPISPTDTTPTAATTTTAVNTSPNHDSTAGPIVLGSLQVEPYSWKYYNGGCQSIIKIRTGGTKAVTLNLLEGRHVFKLHMSATFGYHISLHSQTPFSLTDEDGVLALLNSPSERFSSHCQSVFKRLLNIASLTKDPEAYDTLLLQTVGDHPMQGLRAHDAHAMRAAMLHTFHMIGAKHGLSNSQIFAWKSFTNKLMVEFASHLLPSDDGNYIPFMQFAELKKLKIAGIQGITVTDDDLKQLTEDMTMDDPDKKKKESDTLSSLPSHIINKSRKGSAAGLRRMSAIQGSIELQDSSATNSSTKTTIENDKEITTNQLITSIEMLESHVATFGDAIFQSVFILRPDIMTLFPFGTDENSRAYYKPFTITPVPTMEPYKWSVLFRNKFQVPISQDVSFRLQQTGVAQTKKYLIKIIDNDTGDERIIGLPYPISCTVHPNELGYTLLGEVWTLKEQYEGADKFTLCLISSTPYLPVFNNAEEDKLQTEFHTVTIKNYYLPERGHTMLRYAIKVSGDCHVTIQLDTSKTDALFKLKVSDGNNKVISSCERSGHCVVPSLHLTGPSNATDNKEDSTPTENHVYIIDVKMLQDSWPVAESAWQYISMIKSTEKEDKPSSGKKSKGGGRTSKTPASSKPTPGGGESTIDSTKPHWTLRVVTDIESSSSIKVVRDTEKEDSIKSQLKAWQDIDEGRNERAQKSRQKFLETHSLVKDELTTEEELTSETAVSVSTAVSGGGGGGGGSVPSFGPIPLKPIDLSPYMKMSYNPPKLMDKDYEQECATEQKIKQNEFIQWYEQVTSVRDIDCDVRNELKQTQLSMARSRQMALDATRKRLNSPREEIRNDYLEEERKKQELLAAERAREEAALSSSGRDSKRKSPKTKKK